MLLPPIPSYAAGWVGLGQALLWVPVETEMSLVVFFLSFQGSRTQEHCLLGLFACLGQLILIKLLIEIHPSKTQARCLAQVLHPLYSQLAYRVCMYQVYGRWILPFTVDLMHLPKNPRGWIKIVRPHVGHINLCSKGWPVHSLLSIMLVLLKQYWMERLVEACPAALW